MIFSTPEREFLRLCAMVKPDWAAMAQIARTALDYGLLRRLSLLHQLDGVVAWRLLDDKLDGIVPEIVREDCRRYLDYLDGVNAPWWGEVTDFCATLERLGYRFIVNGGPSQYSPLGIKHFPRQWDDLDIVVDAWSEHEVEMIFAEAKGIAEPVETNFWSIHLPGGAMISLVTCLPNVPHPDGINWTVWDRPIKRISVLGIELPMPDPTLYIAERAYMTWCGVFESARRLPLWGLARLAAWMQDPTFSPEVLIEVLRSSPEVSDRAFWTLKIAKRVYDLALPDITAPEPELRTIDRLMIDRKAQYEHHYLTWNWPGDEAMLFDHQLTEGMEARLRAGLWQQTGKPPEAFRLDEIGRQVPEKAQHA